MGYFLQGLSQGGETYNRNRQTQATTAYQRALIDQMQAKQTMDAFTFEQEQDALRRGHQFFAPGQETRLQPPNTNVSDAVIGQTQSLYDTPEPVSLRGRMTDPRGFNAIQYDTRRFEERPIEATRSEMPDTWDVRNLSTETGDLTGFTPSGPQQVGIPIRTNPGMQPTSQTQLAPRPDALEMGPPAVPEFDYRRQQETVATPSQFEHLAQTQGFDPRTTALVQAAYHLGGPQAASSLMDDIVKQVTAENAASLRGSNMWETRQVQSEDGIHVIQVNKQTGEQREVSKYALKPFAQSDADRMVSTLSGGQYRTVLDAAKAGHPEYGEQAFKKLRQDYPTNVIVGSAMDKPLQPSQSLTARMPLGSSLRQAVGKMPLSEVEVTTLQEAEKAKILIEDIEKYALRVPDVKPGLLNRAVGGASNYAKALAQTNQDAYMLTTKHGEMANLARSLGEKGVLTEQDMARVKDLLPLLSDVMAIRKQKLVDLRAIVDKGIAVYVAKLKTNYPQQKELQNKTKSEAEQLYDEERAKAEKEMQ